VVHDQWGKNSLVVYLIFVYGPCTSLPFQPQLTSSPDGKLNNVLEHNALKVEEIANI
jgi:hypothetical protein